MERLRRQYRRGRWWPLVAWLTGALVAGPAMAGPRGGNVVAGEATISLPDTSTTHIQQSSQRVFIDFDSYDVGVDESVIYSQPGQSAIAVNRILDQKPSEIFGTLKADGTIFLVNSRGIIFGENATLDVGGLVASGLSISLDDFLKGEYRFEDANGGVVVNRGLIQAATGGSVALLGAGVENRGLIQAELGSVTMAAGSRAHLTFDMDGLIGVEIDEGVTQALPELEALVSNEGRILADGGRVVLTGETASGLFDTVVNNEGVIEAGRIEKRGGKVMLLGSGGDVAVSGSIDVAARDDTSDGGMIRIESDAVSLVNDAELSAVSSSGVGGDVQILGDRVGLLGETRVDVSGGTGGGGINVGGNFQGKGPLSNASRTLVGADVSVLANALLEGDGGEIVVWSDDYTVFGGTLMARGAGSGAGGFAEVSSASSLSSRGTYDLSSDSGIAGTLLFDPSDIVITGGSNDGDDATNVDVNVLEEDAARTGQILFADTPATFNVYESEIEGTGASTNIVLQASNSITVTGTFGDSDSDTNPDIDVANDLTLETSNGGSGIDMTGGNLGELVVGGTLSATAGTGGSITLPDVEAGTVTLDAGSAISIGAVTASTGDVNATAGNGITLDTITTTTGNVLLTATGGNILEANETDADKITVPVASTVTLTTSTGDIGSSAKGGKANLDVNADNLVISTGGSFFVDVTGSLSTLDLTVNGPSASETYTLDADNFTKVGDFSMSADVSGDLTLGVTSATALDLTLAFDSGSIALGSVSTANGSLTVTSAADMTVGDVDTNSSPITLTAASTIEAASPDGGVNLTGGAISLTSTGDAGIGQTTDLDIVSTSLAADGGNITLDLTDDTDGTTLTSIDAMSSVVITAGGPLAVGSVSATDDVTISATTITDDVNDATADITSGTDPGDGVFLTTTGGAIGASGNTLDVNTKELTLDADTTFNIDVTSGTSLTLLDLTLDQADVSTTSDIGADNFASDPDFDVQTNAGALDFNNVTSRTLLDLTVNVDTGNLILDVIDSAGGAIHMTTPDGDISMGNVDAGSAALTLSAFGALLETTQDAAVDITGGTVTLTSANNDTIGGGNRLEIDSTALTITGGAITIDEASGGELTSLTAAGAVDVTSNGALMIGGIDAGANTVTVATSNGSIEDKDAANTDADVTGSSVSLTSSANLGTAGNPLDVNSGALTLSTGTTLNVDAVDVLGSPRALTDLDITVTRAGLGTTSAVGASNIATFDLNDTGTAIAIVDVTGGFNFSLSGDANMEIGVLSMGSGNVTLATSGTILEGTNDAAVDVSGGAVSLTSTTNAAIGGANRLEISSSSLGIDGGPITVADVGGTAITSVVSTGAVDLTSDGALTDFTSDNLADVTGSSVQIVTVGDIGTGASSLDIDTADLTLDTGGMFSVDMRDAVGGVVDLASLDLTVDVASFNGSTLSADQLTFVIGSDGVDATLTTVSDATGLAFDFTSDSGDILIGSIVAGANPVSIAGTGAINDFSDDLTLDVSAAAVTLTATDEIGGTAPASVVDSRQALEIRSTSLVLDGTSLVVSDVGGTTLSDLNASGAIDILSNASLSIIAVDAGTTAKIETTAGAIDGGTTTGGTIDFDATTGLTNLATAATSISADTTGGNVDIANVSATPVMATSLTTGTGTITFDQSGGGGLTVGTATTASGLVDIDVAGADLTVGGLVQAGGAFDVDLSTSAGAGDVIVSGGANVDASGNQIVVTSAGAIDGPGTLTASNIDFNAVTGIGAGIALATVAGTLTADSVDGGIDIDNLFAGSVVAPSLTTASGNITFDQSGGALNLGTVTTTGSVTVGVDGGNLTFTSAVSPGGDLTLRTTSSGDVLLSQALTATGSQITIDAAGAINGAAPLSGATVDLDAGSGIGDTTALNLAATSFSADTVSGDVDINSGLASSTTATSLSSGPGTGSITLDHGGGGTLTVDNASTADGAIDVTVDGALLTVGASIAAGGANDVTLTTLNSGDVALTGSVSAVGDRITVTTPGAINGAGLLTASVIDLNAASGIGATTALETAASTITADTTTGTIDLDNTLASDVAVQSLTTTTGGIVFDQAGGGTVTFTTVRNDAGDITLGSDADVLIGDIDANDLLGNGDTVAVSTVGAINDAQDDLIADITAPAVALTASGDVGGVVSGGAIDPAKALEIETTDLTVNAANATLGDPTGGIVVDVTVSGDLALSSNGDFLIDSVSAGGDVVLTAFGSINDAADDLSVDVTGQSVTLTAGTGGPGDVGGTVIAGNAADPRQALEIVSTSLTASGDDIVITDIGGTTLSLLDAVTNIDLQSNGNLFDDADDLLTDLSAKNVSITTTGDIGGLGPTNLVDVRRALEIDATTLTLSADDVVVGAIGGAILSDLSATNALDLESSGNLVLGTLSAGTDLRVVSNTGSVTDLSLDSVVDLDAPGTITVSAFTNIGGAAAGQAIDFADGASVIASAGGSINVQGLGSLTLDVSGGGDLTSLTVGTDLTLSSTGADINAPSAVTVPGTLTVDATGNVSLADPDNQFGTVLMTAGGDASVTDIDTFILGSTDVAGDYDIVMFGALDDAGTLLVGGTLSIDPNGNAVTLDQAGNDLGGLSVVETTDLTVVEDSDLALGVVQVTGDASFALLGDLTDVASVDVAGTLSVDAGGSNVILDTTTNDFNVVTLTSVGTAILVDSSALVLQDTSISGSLDVTAAGNISSATDLSVGALATFSSGADVILGSAGNDFGSVAVTAGDDVALTDVNGIELAGFDISGNLTLTAGGDVTDSGALLIAGTAAFDTPGSINLNENANDFGSVQVASAVDAFFVDVDDLNVAPSTLTGDLDIRADGNVSLSTSTVGGALDVRTAGVVDQGGALIVSGNASFNTGGFNLTLSDPGNDLSSVTVLVAQDVVLNDANTLVLDNVTANGNLTVGTVGAITDAGRVRVLGNTNILAGSPGASADVTLDNAANDFASVRVLRANNVSLVDASEIDLGSAAVDGTFTLTSGGNVTSSGALVLAGQMTVNAGGNDVTLTSPGNDFSIFSGNAINNLALVDVDGIVIEPTNVFGNFDLTASGTVDATGRISVGGVADLSAGGGSFVLDRVAHGFNEIRLNGDGASLVDDSALVLGAVTLASDLTISSAGAITQNGGPAMVPGTAAFDAGGNDVRLDATGNDFATVTFNNVDDVAVVELNDIVLGDSVINGTLNITAGGSIGDASAISVGGLTTLSAGTDITFDGTHDFSTLAITDAQNAVVVDVNALTLAASSVSGNLTLSTGGVLTSNQQLTVGGLFAVDVGATDLALTNSANDFGVLGMQARDALVVDVDGLVLGSSTLAGDLTIASGGAISDVAPVVVAGALSLDASGGAVTLDSAGNVFPGVVTAANVSDLTLVSGSALLLGEITLGGGLDLDANGSITQAGATTLTVPGPSTFFADGAIDLSSANDLQGEVRLTALASGDAFVRTNDLILGTSVVDGSLATDSQSLTLVGDVFAVSYDLSNSGPVTVGGGQLVTLSAVQDVDLGTSPVNALDSNVDGLAILTLGDVTLGVVGGTTPLQSLEVQGSTITLDGNVTTLGDQSFDGPITFNANDVVFSGASAAFTDALMAPTVTATFDADASFGGAVTLASLQSSGGVTFGGGDVTTSGDQVYLGSVTLESPDGDTLLDGANLSFAGAIVSPVAGSNGLVLQSVGDVTFGGQASVGTGGQALSHLDVTAGNGISLSASRVETTDGQTYRNPFTLAADATLVNNGTGEVGFLDTLSGSGVENLLIDGAARFDGFVSGLASLTVTGASNLNTASIFTMGPQAFGSTRLGTNVTLTASDVTFTGDVDSLAGQPGNTLQIALTGNTAVFAGDVGTRDRLGALSVNRDASFAGSVLTADSDVTIGGITRLAGPVVTIDTDSGPGDITLGGIDGQGNDLILLPGTGSVTLSGDALDLNDLTVDGADQVSFAGITAAGDVSVTGATAATLNGDLAATNLTLRVENGLLQNADVAVSDAAFIETNQGSLIMAEGTHTSGTDVSLVNRDATLQDDATAILVSQIDAANEIRVGAAQGNIFVTPVPEGEGNFSGTTLRIGADSLVPPTADVGPDFESLAGDRFGTPDQPAIIDVSDLVVINSRIASQSVFLIRPDVLTENSLRELSLAQTLEAVGDTQRTTVVQLVLLDPAIFTAVSNVDSEEEPVRLPEDQRPD